MSLSARSYRLLLGWCALCALALGLSLRAEADGGYQHVVREGETLASIAERYYGDPRRENILVAENGLTAQGGSPIVVGLRLQIPYVQYHRVQPGETWAELSTRFYGDPRRAFVLMDANQGSSSEQPAEGAELLVPYPLRHVAAQGENVPRIAKAYFGRGAEHSRRLRRFNALRMNRLTRGQIVLIPLSDLVLSDEGREIIREATGQAPEEGQMRVRQAEIDEQLPTLQELVRTGRFAEAIALGNRLLGTGVLTGSQEVTIQRELGTSFVALGQQELAVSAFRGALARQPHLELDSARTSPRVMRAFHDAQRAQESATEDAPEEAEAQDRPASESDTSDAAQ